MTHSPLLTLALTACYITGCAYGGIRSADSFKPVQHHECKVWVTDGRHATCLSREEFERWMKRNGL